MYKATSRRPLQAGFTIIELLFASAAFSIILLICITVLIRISSMYYKSALQSQTQEVARAAVADISRPLQFSTADPSAVKSQTYGSGSALITVKSFCIGSTRYSYVFKKKMTTDPTDSSPNHVRHVLWRDTTTTPATCTPLDLRQPTPSSIDTVAGSGKELLAPNIRLLALTTPQPTTGLWAVNIQISYGEEDVFTNSSYDQCLSTRQGLGVEFCSVINLNTIVTRRL